MLYLTLVIMNCRNLIFIVLLKEEGNFLNAFDTCLIVYCILKIKRGARIFDFRIVIIYITYYIIIHKIG